jgi:hypothetical protein
MPLRVQVPTQIQFFFIDLKKIHYLCNQITGYE